MPLPTYKDRIGPLPEGDRMIISRLRCPGCWELFKVGDYVTFVLIGPGNDEEERQKAREGRPYVACAAACHWACVTGEVE